MKTTFAVLLTLLLVGGTFAQQKQRPEKRKAMSELSVAQKAELQTKKMTLQLDLTANQQKEVRALAEKNLAERAAKRKEMIAGKAEGKTLTSDQRFELATERLDAQISMKNDMKSILNADQYTKWEKTIGKRKRGRKQAKPDNTPKRK